VHCGGKVNDYSDAAKRASDAYNLHRVADPHGSIGKWIAVRLSDGTTDDTLYDSKQDAVRGQHHNEDYYAFVQVGPWSFTPQYAETFLKINRRMYDKGLRLADRDHSGGGRDLIRRVTREDQFNQLRSMFRGDRAPSNIILPGV
jgi:hypothetical protein